MAISTRGDNLGSVVLEQETEQFLAWAARAGDGVARELLIASGYRWVDLHARRLGHFGDGFDDATAAGREALIRAVDRFDPRRGVRLVTFAWPWIARAMQPVSKPEFAAIEDIAQIPDEPAEKPDVSLLTYLTTEQVKVIGMRFGFGDELAEPLTRQAVAIELGLSVWQVRTIEAKAISELKRVLDRVSNRAP